MNRIRWSGWLPTVACFALVAACGGQSESTPSTGGTGGTGGSGTGGSGTGGSGGTVIPTGGSGGTGGECPPGAGACGGANGACSLNVIASGKLPDPIAPTAKLTGPSIVATDDVFVIGYRDQDGGTLRGLVTTLSDDGTLGAPSVFDLGGCSSVVPTDGTGMAYASGSGMFVASLPNCGAGAGAVFIPFDSKGSAGQATGPKNAAFDSLTLAQQSSLAPASVADEFDLLYRVSTGGTDVVERVVLQGPGFKNTPIAHPFGEGGVEFGMVASGPSARALVGAKGASGLEVQLGPTTSDSLQTAETYTLPASPFAALTAWDNRAAALVPTSTGLSWHAFELSGPSTAQELGSGSVTMPPPAALALAVLGNQLVVAAGNPKQISVRRQAGAKTQPFSGLDKTVQLSSLGGGASLDAFDGTHIAMAAARSKIAVVWLTRHALAAGQPTGGWALLECNNP